MADDTGTKDSKVKEIRDRFAYATNEWQKVREEGDKDMRYVAGDCWEDDARRARETAKRPVLNADELGQYINQVINDVRANKRAIRVTQEGAGATDKRAQHRANLIRQIEYRSNAQWVYAGMFENTVQRSYGHLRVKPVWSSPTSDVQELRIVGMPNPDLVTPDPDFLIPTGEDYKYLFNGEWFNEKDFKARWPKAKLISFDADQQRTAGVEWLNVGARRLLVAEQWYIETKKRQLLRVVIQPPAPIQPGVRPPEPPKIITFFEDEKDKLAQFKAMKLAPEPVREVDYPYVKMCMVNGLEILEEHPFPGTSIPFVSCYGKVLYAKDSGATTRKIMSMIRLGRDPQMLYAYMITQEAEIVGMIPKAPVQVVAGQLEGYETEWAKANHEPVAFLRYKATVEGLPPGQLLPPPSRLDYNAGQHLGALEVCKESARRAIQAAMGISPLPTQAQRKNEKSGKALEQIESASQKGSFHFIDNFDAAIQRTGAILDELLPHYYDSLRQVTVRKPDDKAEVITINDPNDPDSQVAEGRYDVTISVGPKQDSERQAASEFADLVVGNLGQVLAPIIGPQKMAELISLAIRLKSVGPLGDAMADLISPPKEDQGQPSVQQVQELQAQLQQAQQMLQQAQMAIETDQAKQRATIDKAKIDAQAEVMIAKLRESTAVAIAKLQHLVKPSQEAQAEAIEQDLERQHERIMQEDEQQHEIRMAGIQAAVADRQTAGQQRHQSVEAERGRQHERESGERTHEQTIEQAHVEADLQPKPEDSQT